MKKNWKTTVAGIGVILSTLGNAIGEWKTGGLAAVNIGLLITGLGTGIGLIMAKDFNVTGTATTPAP